MTEHDLKEFYTGLYANGSSHDSPERSRINMQRRIIEAIKKRDDYVSVLGVGSGRGVVEGSIQRDAHGAGDCRWQELVEGSLFVTLDVADIPRSKLVNPRARTHVQADSRRLPFASESFDIVSSNLSIDMLRRNNNGDYEQALSELHRVLKLGGAAIFSFHPHGLFDILSKFYKGKKNSVPAEYYDGNPHNNPFYQRRSVIRDELGRAGLRIETIEPAIDNKEAWWEVTADKLA